MAPAAAGRVAVALTLAFLAACEDRGARDRDGSDAGSDAASAAISPPSSGLPSDDEVIAALRPFEGQLHREIDLFHPPSSETGLGADPWKVARLPGTTRHVGILRGRSELVLLGDDLRAIARAKTPRSPTGLAVGPDGTIWVTGELSRTVARFVVQGDAIVESGKHDVAGVFGLRDVAVTASGVAWVIDERTGRLHSLSTKPGAGARATSGRAPCHGASQLTATPRHLVVGCATEHEVLVFDTDASGAITNADTPRKIHHDGPVWGFDAREIDGGSLVVAIGGVEDKPLDRRDGFFGWIDSFVFVYRFDAAAVVKLATVNVGEKGVVTPKALAITRADATSATMFVAAYGAANAATVSITKDAEPSVVVRPLVPGIRAVAASGESMVMADPLLDAWVSWSPDSPRKVVAADDAPPAVHPQTRLGEALFFTTLMAPENSTEGAHSRFTCETCHFEGYGDGRTHHTGREDIHAVTKPLVGLFGNRPYFTRALDPDLSTIAHAEFRVAGAGSGTSPFFVTDSKRVFWLEDLVPSNAASKLAESLDGYELRRSLMRFLASFSHRPNPAVIGRKAFTATERRGAGVFRDRCETCHAARLIADEGGTTIPFESWEASIFSDESPIVWARAGYEKTGIEPYVHPEGARTTSLRRMYKKFPFFTNGSAKSKSDVVTRVRIAGPRLFHGNAPPEAAPLHPEEQSALLAFLELL